MPDSCLIDQHREQAKETADDAGAAQLLHTCGPHTGAAELTLRHEGTGGWPGRTT
jgi:hypothetical protein